MVLSAIPAAERRWLIVVVLQAADQAAVVPEEGEGSQPVAIITAEEDLPIIVVAEAIMVAEAREADLAAVVVKQ